VERNPEPEAPRSRLRGGASLIVAAALVFILLVWLPAYRWFLLGSLGIGVGGRGRTSFLEQIQTS